MEKKANLLDNMEQQQALSAYELKRESRIAENLSKLRSLGLDVAVDAIRQMAKPRKKKAKKTGKGKRGRGGFSSGGGSSGGKGSRGSRKSRRVRGLAEEVQGLQARLFHDADDNHQGKRRRSRRGADDEDDEDDEEEEEEEEARWPKRSDTDRFGACKGIKVGHGFDSRADACAAGVHRATVAGIVGKPSVGCFSITLNGGYADDVDKGGYVGERQSGKRKGRLERQVKRRQCSVAVCVCVCVCVCVWMYIRLCYHAYERKVISFFFLPFFLSFFLSFFRRYLTYTGSGGRSLKGTAGAPKNLRTGPHTKNQTLHGNEGRYNASLAKSLATQHPVRVMRGYKLESEWAPLGVRELLELNYLNSCTLQCVGAVCRGARNMYTGK